MTITDKKRLDFLQHLTDKNRNIVCRFSGHGRGWRLHETRGNGLKDIRSAIDVFIIDCYNANRDDELLKGGE